MHRLLVLFLSVGCASTTPADVDAGQLPLLPEIDASCTNLNLAEAGPCCQQAFCYTPADGGACEDNHAGFLVSMAGQCSCGPSSGPYQSPDPSRGTCCYLAWGAGCQ